MAIDTTLRTNAGGAGATTGTRTSSATRLAATSAAVRTDDSQRAGGTATSAPVPLRSNAAAASQVDGAMQDQVARAQQALDYLDRVSTQLESLKSELTARLASATRSGARQQAAAGTQQTSQKAVSQPLEAQVRQLAATLAARKRSGGRGVDSNLTYTAKPATQSFRIRGIDIGSLKQGAPQSVAFSVGSVGGPQTSVNIEPDQSSDEVARALDRALAPMGVHASLDQDGQLVFSTDESNWASVKDSIAVSGRGRVTTDEVTPALAPQQWGVGGDGSGNTDALRQSLREVVQALERVHQSQTAATDALASATVQVAAAETPPPDVQLAADDFASAASNTDYDSLLSLTSALVGVSRERVIALLGLN